MLLIGAHAIEAHGFKRDSTDFDCIIGAENVNPFRDRMATHSFGEVYRTPYFVKYRQVIGEGAVVEAMLVDSVTFQKLIDDSIGFDFDGHTFRIPGLKHVIAMNLQVCKFWPDREPSELRDIAALLRANQGRWKDAEIEDVCRRFGPKGIQDRLTSALGR